MARDCPCSRLGDSARHRIGAAADIRIVSDRRSIRLTVRPAIHKLAALEFSCQVIEHFVASDIRRHRPPDSLHVAF
jgi:hypothetical protein